VVTLPIGPSYRHREVSGDSISHDLKGLVWTLIRTDFKVRYHRTLMGFVWALLKPLVLLLAMLAVFSFVFHNERDYALNLILGIFLWEFFAEATKVGLISLHQKGFLLSKSQLPRWILVVTSLSNALITLAIVSALFLAGLAIAGRAPSPGHLALFAVYLACFFGIAIGFSLGASVLFLQFRDLNQIWEVVCSAGFFLAPIVYPLSALPERYHFLFYVWPPTPIIQFSRAVLLGGPLPTLKAHLMLAAMVAIILAIGAALFARLSPRSAERL
jgi:lipopolysaccharide transport system permease protein